MNIFPRLSVFTVLLCVFTLCACGGGGGTAASTTGVLTASDPGDNTDDTPGTGNSAPVVSAPDTVAEPDPLGGLDASDEDDKGTNSLEVPEGFNISEATSWNLDVALALPQDKGMAFVMVCQDYTSDAGGLIINYDNCVIRESFDPLSGNFSKTVVISSGINSLVLSVWFPGTGDLSDAIEQEYIDLGVDNTRIVYPDV